MRRVEHAGLISPLGAGVLSDGRPYICMPRLHGETLAARVARGRLPVETAVAIFDVMARAVGALHRDGLIHRDLKPENVFLQGPVDRGSARDVTGEPRTVPRPIVLDLGIAREVDGHASTTTVTGQVRGTPAYMAPERFFGSPANELTDIYELAVTLYMMLVGSLPWDGAQSASARLSPRHPRDVGVELPAELVTLVLRALSTRPEVRPPRAEAFADAVSAAVGLGADGRTTAAVSIASRPDLGDDEPEPVPARVRWVVPAAAVALLAVAVIAVRPFVQPSSASTGSQAAAVVQPGPAVRQVHDEPPPPVASVVAQTPPAAPAPPELAMALPLSAPTPSARPRAVASRTPIRSAVPATSASPVSDPERYYLDRK
jgi:serine/threonine-protein kinase